MGQYTGDLGILFAAVLVIIFLMWDRLFPH